MVEEEKKTDLKEKYPQLYEVFSEELIDFALSKKTAQKIANICIEYKVLEKEEVEGVAFRVTYALFGKLPKENLALVIEEGVGIEKEKAEGIAKRVDEIIFSELPSSEKKKETEKETPAPEEKKQRRAPEPFEKDAYREPID